MTVTDTRQHILDVAKQVFSEKGFVGTTTKEITLRADVNEVTLFRHFGNKENLFLEGIKDCCPKNGGVLDIEKTGDLETDLTALANNYLKDTLKHTDFIRIYLMELPRSPELLKNIVIMPPELQSNLTSYLEELCEKGLVAQSNFKLLSQLFYINLFDYILHTHVLRLSRRQGVSKDDTVSTVVKLFVGGLKYEFPEDSSGEDF